MCANDKPGCHDPGGFRSALALLIGGPVAFFVGFFVGCGLPWAVEYACAMGLDAAGFFQPGAGEMEIGAIFALTIAPGLVASATLCILGMYYCVRTVKRRKTHYLIWLGAVGITVGALLCAASELYSLGFLVYVYCSAVR